MAGRIARIGSQSPSFQAEYKKTYNRDLAPPKTLTELVDIAKFFQGKEIDGKKVYGAAIFTERGSEGITMGVSNFLYPYGFKYEDPKKPYSMEGFVNSPGAVKGLEAYKALYKCCTPPGYTDAYMQEGLDAFKSGQVAMQMNWFAFFPGLAKDEKVGGTKSASSSTRARARRAPSLAARASRSSPIRPTRMRRWPTSSGLPRLRSRRSGGLSAAIRQPSRC